MCRNIRTLFNFEPPATEEEIRAHTIGELQPLAGPIQIDGYDPLWPELFAREAAKVGAALGSTATPRVAALTWKPTACGASWSPMRRGVSAMSPG